MKRLIPLCVFLFIFALAPCNYSHWIHFRFGIFSSSTFPFPFLSLLCCRFFFIHYIRWNKDNGKMKMKNWRIFPCITNHTRTHITRCVDAIFLKCEVTICEPHKITNRILHVQRIKFTFNRLMWQQQQRPKTIRFFLTIRKPPTRVNGKYGEIGTKIR